MCLNQPPFSRTQRAQRSPEYTAAHFSHSHQGTHTCTHTLLQKCTVTGAGDTHTHTNDNKMICRWPCCTDLLLGSDLSGGAMLPTPPRAFKEELQSERERWGGRGDREREREKMSEEKGGGRVMKAKKQRKEGGCGQTS